MTISEYWKKFLDSAGLNEEEAGFSGEFSFEPNFVGEQQLFLLLNGKKTAAFSTFESYGINMEPLPVTGELYIVENKDGEPKAVIEVTDVTVRPFGDITWELARKDGENENLEEWKERQKEYFEEEAAICGFDFNESSKILCQQFKVIFR